MPTDGKTSSPARLLKLTIRNQLKTAEKAKSSESRRSKTKSRASLLSIRKISRRAARGFWKLGITTARSNGLSPARGTEIWHSVSRFCLCWQSASCWFSSRHSGRKFSHKGRLILFPPFRTNSERRSPLFIRRAKI